MISSARVRRLGLTLTLVVTTLACAQGPSVATAGTSGGGEDTLRTLQPVAADGAGVRPAGLAGDAASGSLTVLALDGERPEEVLELPLRHTEVAIQVSGYVARARVTQTYANPYDAPIEAVYAFPLPHEAAVDDMVMRIGSRTIRADIKRRSEAREIYERARDAGQRAALLEQERPNIFTQSVANILPGDEIEVTLSYVDLLAYGEGAYELVFPMVVGPRYIPGGRLSAQQGTGSSPDTDQVPDASRITPPVLAPGQRSGHDIALTVELDAGVPIRGLHSTSHAVDVTRRGQRRATVAIHPSDTLPNKDFVLRYEVAGAAPQAAVLAHHDERGGFFTLMVQPQRSMDDDDVVPRELIFILDTSGSMRGFPLERSKEAMRRLIDGMRPGDTFNVVRFAGDSGTLWPRPLPYTSDNARAALAYVDALQGAGGTEMRRGIMEALGTPAEPGMLRLAFLLTDGYVGNEAEILRTIEETRRGARVFTLGVGSSVNRYLIDGAAAVGLGEAFYVRQDESSREIVDRFFARVDRPALAHVEVDWGSLDVEQLTPGRVPDLWAGQPILVHGRYARGGRETITIRGQLGASPWEQRLEVELPSAEPANAAIASVWARQRIEGLMLDMARGARPAAEVEASVTELGLGFRLMTQWTSFVAVEEKVVNVDGRPQTVVQPVELPEGVDYEGVFGDGAGDERMQMLTGKMRQLAVSGAASPAFAESLALPPPGRPRVPIADPTPSEPAADREVRRELDAAAAKVELGTVAVSGGLRHAHVARVLETALPDLRRAVSEGSRRGQRPSGRVTVTLELAPDGTVGTLEIEDDAGGDERLEQALRRVLARLAFGPVAGGGPAKVVFDLELG